MEIHGDDRMHANSGLGFGITVRAHMALEITKALIINPTLYDRDSEGGEVPLTDMAVKVADKLIEKLED